MTSAEETLPAAAGRRSRGRPLERGQVVGRYVVLARLGAGGMGVVHAAYDPELDRKVAIKLLHPGSGGSRDSDGHLRLLREAQAMAKLSHPNVVTVHDVGEHEGRVYVAMEFVEGETLAAWLKRERTWSEVLDMFVHAAAGLIAAHEKGLVHRDFKPENVMVDADGRVRVMDFGLARATAVSVATAKSVSDSLDLDGDVTQSGGSLDQGLTKQGSIMGTPAYMAPEQHLGEAVDARTDQFSFCVALWEGLFGQRPFDGRSLAELALNVTTGRPREPSATKTVPGWLRRVVQRGLSVDPDARFASLTELLEAIAGATRRRRRRLVLGAGGLVVLSGLGAWTIHTVEQRRRVEQCETGAATGAEVWSEPAKARLHDALLGTGVSYAQTTFEHTVRFLDEHAATWQEQYHRLCKATVVDGSRSQALWSSSRRCLEDRRGELESLISVLTTDPDSTTVRRSVAAAWGFGRWGRCDDDAWLTRNPGAQAAHPDTDALRQQLWRASALDSAGRYDEALAITLAVVEELDDGTSLRIRALLKAGSVASRAAQYEQSERLLTEAFGVALETGEDDAAITAANRLTFLMGTRLPRYEEAKLWAGIAQRLVARLGLEDDHQASSVHSNLGVIYVAQGRYEEAEQAHKRSLAIRERVLGPVAVDVASALNDLGITYAKAGRLAEAERALARVTTIREQMMGPDHPIVAQALNNLANVYQRQERYPESEQAHVRALRIRERALGVNHPDLADSCANLGRALRATEKYAEAESFARRAVSIRERSLGPRHPEVANAYGGLAAIYRAEGKVVESERAGNIGIAILEETRGVDDAALVPLLTNMGRMFLEAGRAADAERTFERALLITERNAGPDHPFYAHSLVGRARARLKLGRAAEALADAERGLEIRSKTEAGPELLAVVQFVLARALVDTRGDRERARSLAEQARTTSLEANGPKSHAAAEIGQWMADQGLVGSAQKKAGDSRRRPP